MDISNILDIQVALCPMKVCFSVPGLMEAIICSYNLFLPLTKLFPFHYFFM